MKPRLLVLMIIIFISGSCTLDIFQDEYHDLQGDKRFKYKVGDTLIYFDKQNESDTFFITKVLTDYRESDKKYHYQYQNIYFRSHDTALAKKNTVYFESTKFEIYWNNTNTIQFLDYIESSDIKIGNYCFQNAYNLGDTLVFNYQYGVIRYKKGNKIFELEIK